MSNKVDKLLLQLRLAGDHWAKANGMLVEVALADLTPQYRVKVSQAAEDGSSYNYLMHVSQLALEQTPNYSAFEQSLGQSKIIIQKNMKDVGTFPLKPIQQNLIYPDSPEYFKEAETVSTGAITYEMLKKAYKEAIPGKNPYPEGASTLSAAQEALVSKYSLLLGTSPNWKSAPSDFGGLFTSDPLFSVSTATTGTTWVQAEHQNPPASKQVERPLKTAAELWGEEPAK